MNTIELAAIIAVAKREVELRVTENGAVKGDQGLIGPTGKEGPQGPKGDRGERGGDGPQGAQGIAGSKGDKGDTGPQGEAGQIGPKGNDGNTPAPAVSIRDVYVDPDDGDLYVELTNSRLINAGHVKGEDGKPGKDGRNGFTGGGGSSAGGASLPAGGSTGQVLAKASNADQDVSWQTVSGIGISDGDKGDIVVSGGGTLWTLDPTAASLVNKQPLSTVLTNTTASYTTAEQTKLAGIAAGATVNSADATLLARANHTGTQAAATITGLASLATSGSAADLSSGILPAARFDDTAHGARAGGTLHANAVAAGAAGFMTGADKTKLDGIAAGAQVNVGTNIAYTAATRAIASSTGTGATLPIVTTADAGLAPASGGGTTNFLRADGTWAAPAGGGGGAVGGTATINFGSAPGTNIASVVVTGQGAIGASSRIKVWFQGGSTADFNEYEHLFILPGSVSLMAGTIVNGVGFTIYATTQLRIRGNVVCRWEWS
jgi:hypothetical protein